MKTLAKWAGLLAVPSILLYLYVFRHPSESNPILFAVFYLLHAFFAGVAIYFVFKHLKENSEEAPTTLRFILIGILTSVVHSLIFSIFSAIHINHMVPQSERDIIEREIEKSALYMHDSTATTTEEYYSHLMEGKDTGFMPRDMYLQYDSAARDSVVMVEEKISYGREKTFGYWEVIKRWSGIMPLIIGLMFSVIIYAYIYRNDTNRR